MEMNLNVRAESGVVWWVFERPWSVCLSCKVAAQPLPLQSVMRCVRHQLHQRIGCPVYAFAFEGCE
jgi:hypothetical protein